ncbi:helix-turn-helix domain-containing protein [Massilia sp. KIM]|uniref:helix-turn-helix domain-containing protein n=1 Tax=Massilia sp. KIM TaxID=1955422 RepID=UPI00098F3BBF
MKRAQQLLCSSDVSIDEISLATDFADTAHFHRAFRKIIGLFPAVWRIEKKR